MTCVIRRSVARSMPFATESTTASGWSRVRTRAAVARIPAEGTANTTSSAAERTDSVLATTSTSAGSSMPGR